MPDWLGGARCQLFEGFQVDRLTLLYGLSGLFLFFVLINGVFKYWINVAKGALGERMLRRMRFDLFALVLRFTPEALRNVKSSETATIIKDEVEPIGGFIGDAFILPAFLGTQAATALIFIMVQNFWLGLMAAGVVSVQFTIIPRLRRELLKLGKQRQLASRRLAGRVGEVVDGIEAVHVHNTAQMGAGRDRPPPLRALRPALPHLQAEVHGQVPEQSSGADDAVLLLLDRRLSGACAAASTSASSSPSSPPIGSCRRR